MSELPDALATGQVAKAVHPEIGDAGAGRQRTAHLEGRVVGEQDLLAVSARADSGAADDGETDVVVFVAQHRIAAVQRHAYRQVGQFAAQRQLGSECRADGIGSGTEDRHDAVALALLLRSHATVDCDV